MTHDTTTPPSTTPLPITRSTHPSPSTIMSAAGPKTQTTDDKELIELLAKLSGIQETIGATKTSTRTQPTMNMTSSSLIQVLLAQTFALSVLYIVLKGFLSFTSISDALAFYGVYHRNPINQLIHFFGVPAIIWSLMVFLAHVNIPFVSSIRSIRINLPGVPSHGLNYASILTMIYVLFYIKMDPFGGVLYAPFAYAMYTTATSLTLQVRKEALMLEKSKDVNGKPKSTGRSWAGT